MLSLWFRRSTSDDDGHDLRALPPLAQKQPFPAAALF